MLAVESEAQKKFVNDDTIEGATVLMNKIGYLIDDKIAKLENSKEKKEEKMKKN